MSLTNDSEWKAYLNYSGTDRDTWAGTMIPVVQEIVETYCGRPAGGFESASWTQDFDGKGGMNILVPCWPITAISSVSYRDFAGNLTTMDSSRYWISADANAVEFGGGHTGRWLQDPNSLNDDANLQLSGQLPRFRDSAKNYRVVYTGGYSSVPQNVKLACWRLLDLFWNQKGQPSNITSESDGAYSYTKSASMLGDPNDPTSIASLLGKWTSPI